MQRCGLLASDPALEPLCPVPPGAPAPPADPDVRKVVEKLAEFVAKNGRNFEEVTRQRNPEDSPFRCT